MRRLILARGTILVVCVAALMAASSASATASSTRRNPWPASQRSGFIYSCMQAGGTTGAYCLCSLHYLQDHYTWRQIAYIYSNQPARMARIIDTARNQCSR